MLRHDLIHGLPILGTVLVLRQSHGGPKTKSCWISSSSLQAGSPELEGACLNTSHLVHLEERICFIRIFLIKALRHVEGRGVLPLEGYLKAQAFRPGRRAGRFCSSALSSASQRSKTKTL